ncbi:S1 family peptidase [Brevibacillus panacihumi]|uniref:S1 family peptidase n=1 Tax=Brevibacillus panacihumi TaxID=497735 RepID=UPI003D03DAD1
MKLSRKIVSLLVSGTLTFTQLPGQIQAQPNNVNYQNHFVTPIDHDEFWERIETQKNIPKVIEYLESDFDENYAGLYVDQENGGIVNIGFYSIPDKNKLSKVSKILGKEAIVKYSEVNYSRNDLENVVNLISETIEKNEDDIVTISSSFADQQVIVGYATDEKSARKKISDNIHKNSLSRLNANEFDDNVFKFVKTKRPDSMIDRASIKVRPVSGAVQMNFEGSGFCTNGFSAKDSQNVYYLVSAGHCASEVGQNVNQSYQNDNYIGTVQKKIFNWGGTVDVSLVKVTSSLTTPNILTTSGNNWNASGYKIIGEQTSDWEGMGVCTSLGETDTQMCGWVQETNASVLAWGGYLTGQKKVNIPVVNGDSGSPVGAPDSKVTSNLNIYGIVSAGTKGQNVAYLSYIGNIKSQAGITTIVGSK